MKVKLIALPALSILSLASGAAFAADAPPSPASPYVATVDPDAFPERLLEHKKLGVTVDPRTLQLVTPGIDKFSIYKLIGPPHFGEGITRRWNYVLFFPTAPGSAEKVRCRMEIRFGKERRDGYNVTVSEVVWKDQDCADRVAAAS